MNVMNLLKNMMNVTHLARKYFFVSIIMIYNK